MMYPLHGSLLAPVDGHACNLTKATRADCNLWMAALDDAQAKIAKRMTAFFILELILVVVDFNRHHHLNYLRRLVCSALNACQVLGAIQ